jgi:hypothetical protein
LKVSYSSIVTVYRIPPYKRDRKITARWIEDCLNRKYRSKSEFSSNSKKVENIKVKDSNVIDTVDNREGSVLLIDHEIVHI